MLLFISQTLLDLFDFAEVGLTCIILASSLVSGEPTRLVCDFSTTLYILSSALSLLDLNYINFANYYYLLLYCKN